MSSPIKFDHKFKFTWHTNWDKPCHVCKSLNGNTYLGTNISEGVLYDPIWGNIWDLYNDMPLTHPHCKCYLEVTYESTLEDLLLEKKDGRPDPFEEFKIMTSNIKQMKQDLQDFDRDLAKAQNRLSNTKAELIAYIQLLQRMGLPPQVEKGIQIFVKAKMTSEQATRALYALQAASLAGGPAAWAFAIATTGLAVLGAYSTASSVMELGGS